MKHLELRALLAWLFLTGTLWCFLALGAEVGDGETSAIDRQLISTLRNTAGPNDTLGASWFYDAMRDVTALGGFVFLTLLTVIFVLVFIFHRKWREAATLVFVAIGAQISIELLKFLYNRPRPDQIDHNAHIYSASFPSGHTTESTAIFLTVAIVLATLESQANTKILAYVVSVLAIIGVGFSRVYLGMHWPTDVLGGWFLGSAWALIGWLILHRPSSPLAIDPTRLPN